VPRPLALLFDLDGTLVDSIDLILTSFRHTFRTHLGEAPPDERWMAGVGTPLVSQIRSLVSDEALVAPMSQTYRAFQLEHHDRLLKEFEGVRETVTELKARGHPIGLVTSKMEDLARRALRRTSLDNLIDAIVAFESSPRHKPDPLPVLVALETLGVASQDALFVGDTPHDIVAGNAADVPTVAALWGPFSAEALRAVKPSFTLSHIRELPPLVASIEARPKP